MIAYFLSKGANLADHARNIDLLYYSVEHNLSEILKWMIKKIKPKYIDKNNNNILLIAYKNKHIKSSEI